MSRLATAYGALAKYGDALELAVSLALKIREAEDDTAAARIVLTDIFGCAEAACAHCGGSFWTGHRTGARSHAIYCSDRCRVAANRARKAGGA